MTTETKGPGVGGGPDVTFSCYRSIIGCLIQIQLAQIKQDRTARPGPAAFEIGSSGGFEMGPVVVWTPDTRGRLLASSLGHNENMKRIRKDPNKVIFCVGFSQEHSLLSSSCFSIP